MTKILLMATLAVILGIIWCSKEEIISDYKHKDFALIEVWKDSLFVGMVGAVPGDTVKMGKYTVVYNKRK